MALIEKLGPSGALRFAMQTERGYGDYAAIRDAMLGRLSVDELLEQMRAATTRVAETGRAGPESDVE